MSNIYVFGAFVLNWVLAMFIALVLSHRIGIQPVSMPKSLSCYFIQRSWAQHEAAATYSASAVDRATEFCFLVALDIKHGP